MVDENFCVHAEDLIQTIFPVDGKPCQVPHRIDAVGFQPLDGAGACHPEIRQRSVVPQQIPVGLLVQLRNADTIFVCRDVLCHNVHRQLCKVEVGADACRCGNAGVVQHLPHHGHGKLVGAHVVIGQIARHIDKNLINGVGVDIRRGHIFEVGLVDLGGHVQIPLHPGRRNDVTQPQRRVCVQGVGIKRGAGKVIFAVLSPDCLVLTDGSLQPLSVDLFHPLDGFKQPRSAGYLVSFQGGRHRKADGLFGAGGVRHHQIRGQGVQIAVYTLHRGIKAFQVDCQIGALCCHDSALLCIIWFPPPRTICRTGTETVGRNVQKTGAVPAPLPLQHDSRRAYRQWYLQGENPAPARWDCPTITPCDLPGLHIAGYVKIRVHLHVDLFCFTAAVPIHSSQLLCKSNNYLFYYNKSLRCFQEKTQQLLAMQKKKYSYISV